MRSYKLLFREEKRAGEGNPMPLKTNEKKMILIFPFSLWVWRAKPNVTEQGHREA